ncbi:cystathionine beta-lyase [Chelatococcus asaccharovorans]|uniref:Cystathionine beta-lyase n=1 Tax=Chelatococcus asaccharovorans TaxID=28210 RepID=A0A2V3U065_9HYPH|nr:cystathionine beta-lyase [Chelatococcus asaccharovorans]MBS7707719.1 cystathionine beta-lyase [Chelatococcus asaccharovorans]PXW55296.1 cystathionine beta-lyase [Chelatococcus asaccharovorans]
MADPTEPSANQAASLADQTLCIARSMAPADGFASLTVPIHRASTIVFPDAEAYLNRNNHGPDSYSYGLHGTPTNRTLEAQIAALEGGAHALVVPSGLSAITLVLAAFLKPGESVLVPDTVYPPVRSFCDQYLTSVGITTTYYDPLLGASIAELIDASVRLILVESPGSTTMEVQDVPAIVAAAKARGVLVACDNAWATPLLFKPLAHGADFAIEAVSKYMGGHSDLLMGSVAVTDFTLFTRLKDAFKLWGLGVSPDDCSLALRGLETLAVRLERSGAAANDLAHWLQDQTGIERVLYPPLLDSPGHAEWRRDFHGASGVFTVVIEQRYAPVIPTALSRLRLFAIGASWGGTRSIVAPMDIASARTVRPWNGGLSLLRFSIGLECIDDLKADLKRLLIGLSAKT